MKNITILLFITIFSASILFAGEVENVTARQEGKQVLFEFELSGEDEAEVVIAIGVEGNTYRADELHLKGDFGKIEPGKRKKIYWDVLKDFPMGYEGDIYWKIIVNDYQKYQIAGKEEKKQKESLGTEFKGTIGIKVGSIGQNTGPAVGTGYVEMDMEFKKVFAFSFGFEYSKGEKELSNSASCDNASTCKLTYEPIEFNVKLKRSLGKSLKQASFYLGGGASTNNIKLSDSEDAKTENLTGGQIFAGITFYIVGIEYKKKYFSDGISMSLPSLFVTWTF